MLFQAMTYLGKMAAIEPLIDDLRGAARKSGFSVRALTEVDGMPVLAFSRSGRPGSKSVYLSAGIHGDEPAGPLTVLELLEAGLPDDIHWHICPAINPTGLKAGTRVNAAGVDLNRDYLAVTQPEVRAHVQWLGEQGPIDLALFLHEDWESKGFYVYELNPRPEEFSAARLMIQAVEPYCPIEHAPRIDGHRAVDGVIIPDAGDLQRPDWPEALFVFTHHNSLNYTLETPSAFALHTRVEAMRAAVRRAAAAFAGISWGG